MGFDRDRLRSWFFSYAFRCTFCFRHVSLPKNEMSPHKPNCLTLLDIFAEKLRLRGTLCLTSSLIQGQVYQIVPKAGVRAPVFLLRIFYKITLFVNTVM